MYISQVTIGSDITVGRIVRDARDIRRHEALSRLRPAGHANRGNSERDAIVKIFSLREV